MKWEEFKMSNEEKEIMNILRQAEAEELVHVVRCKDCKHYKDGRCFFTMRRYGLHDDWFCADGDRNVNQND